MCFCRTIKIRSQILKRRAFENTEAEEERSSKKRRFADVENEELDSIVENAQAKKKKKPSRQHSGQFPYSQVDFNYMNNLLAWLFTETVIL